MGYPYVPIMQGERIVFTEEAQPSQCLKLIASGELDDGLLEALEGFVKRQRKRLGVPVKRLHDHGNHREDAMTNTHQIIAAATALERPWAKESEVSETSVLESDGGFTCLTERSHHPVCRDGNYLYVLCSDGRHYLDGQLSSKGGDAGHYVGFYLVGRA